MLLDQLLRGADVFPAPIFLAVGRALHEILVVRRHDVKKIFRNLDAFLAHYGLLRFARGSEQFSKCAAQLPRPARDMLFIPRAVLISDTMISGGMVMPPHTCGPACTRWGFGIVARISFANHPVTLNSGTKMCLAFFVASRISSSGQGRSVLILTSPQRTPSSSNRRMASRPCDTAVPEATIIISWSMFSVSIKPFSQWIECLRERSMAAQISCCQEACVA